jgi:hypothetical protein
MGPLSGQLIHYFLIAVLDAAVLSWLAIAWYRRRMRALMSASSHAGGEANPPPPERRRPAAANAGGAASNLRLVRVDPRSDTIPSTGGRDSSLADARERRVRLRLMAAYATGAALYSAVISALRLGPEAGTLPVAWLAQWWINMWPIVPTLAVLLALGRRATATLAVKYLGIGCLAVVLVTLAGQVLRGSFNSAPLTNPFWMLASLAWLAFAPLILILVTGWRPIRGVTPMVLAATLLFGAGMLAFRQALVRALNLASFQSAIISVGKVSSLLFAQYALFMVASLPVGWLAWLALRRLAAHFEQKRFSDLQLIVDCWWVIVTAETVTTLWDAHGAMALAGGIVAFGAYRAGVGGVLRLWRLGVNPHSPRLLLLRVFGYQSRTEELFDRIGALWRLRGPVHLIAGPDLATRTVDPGDTLALIGGRLAEQYVASVGEIPHRMAALDRRPDPDGRFRVNEVYCHDDTWRPSLQGLLDSSDGVLMDLRSFSKGNAGCIFELEEIVRRVPIDRVVFVCDRTTDLQLVEDVLRPAWTAASAEGLARGDGQVAVVPIERQSRAELAGLWKRLARLSGERADMRSEEPLTSHVSLPG